MNGAASKANSSSNRRPAKTGTFAGSTSGAPRRISKAPRIASISTIQACEQAQPDLWVLFCQSREDVAHDAPQAMELIQQTQGDVDARLVHSHSFGEVFDQSGSG